MVVGFKSGNLSSQAGGQCSTGWALGTMFQSLRVQPGGAVVFSLAFVAERGSPELAIYQPSDRCDDGHWEVMDMVTGTVNSGVRGFEINDPSSTQIQQFRKGIMEPWREVIAASRVLPKAVFRTSFSPTNPGDLGREGHVLQKQGFFTLQGRMRSEDSHTCRCLPNFSVPQLELPCPSLFFLRMSGQKSGPFLQAGYLTGGLIRSGLINPWIRPPQ